MKIGGGGSCEVFKATLYGVPVAVKALHTIPGTGSAAEESEARQFQTEMAFLKSVVHPNICRLLATSLDGQKRCLVLPLCEGGTLHDRLQGDGTRPALTSLKRVQVMVAVGRALSYLHDTMKQIHRDVKVFTLESKGSSN